MKTFSFNLTRVIRIVLMLLAASCFTLTPHAQVFDQHQSHLRPVQQALLGATLSENYTSDVDATSMSTAEWKTFSGNQVRLLESSDRAAKQAAMQEIIFHATFHRDRVNFRKAAAGLYAIYRFDRDENFRIMALAGLHAIGDEETMRYVYQDVQLEERSPRVRRLAIAALADHFAGQTP